MSAYTDSVSRPGRKLNTGTDDRELFLIEFGALVLEAYKEASDMQDFAWQRTISKAKADSFPIIGRRRDAIEHEAGELVLGGTIEHNEVVVTVDKPLIESVFYAEIDELMAHYDIHGPYARQIGESLGSTISRRTAQMAILAGRTTAAPYTGGPVPDYYFHADLASDASKLEEAHFKAVEYMKENDVSGSKVMSRLPWAQLLLLSRYSGIEGGPVTTGSGNRSSGTVGAIAGIVPEGTNHIPQTNITTGNVKYQGNFATTIGIIGSQMAVARLNLRGMRTIMKEQDDRLGTLLIASLIAGMGALRPECSFELRTNTR